LVTVSLYESAQVTLNSSGNGTAKIGPLSAREIWSPVNAHVSTSQVPTAIVNEAECQVFVGSDTSQQNFRDVTYSGSHGDSTSRINADTIKCGAYVFAVWTGGDPNVIAIITVTGNRDV
jgi:hypothetical protein